MFFRFWRLLGLLKKKKNKSVFRVSVSNAQHTFLDNCERLWITHHQVRAVCKAESNVQCTGMACGWSGTNTPPDEGAQNYLHVPT